jgi:hypothetical protein
MSFREKMSTYTKRKQEIEQDKRLSAEGKTAEIVKLQKELNQAWAEYQASHNKGLAELDKEIKDMEKNTPARPVPSVEAMAAEARAVDLMLSQLAASADPQAFIRQVARLENGGQLERQAFVRGFHMVMALWDKYEKDGSGYATGISTLKGAYDNANKSLMTAAEKAHVERIEEAQKRRGDMVGEFIMSSMLFKNMHIPQHPGLDPWSSS